MKIATNRCFKLSVSYEVCAYSLVILHKVCFGISQTGHWPTKPPVPYLIMMGAVITHEIYDVKNTDELQLFGIIYYPHLHPCTL